MAQTFLAAVFFVNLLRASYFARVEAENPCPG